MAPVGGAYRCGARLLYKINAIATASLRGRLVLNGIMEIHGSLGEVFATADAIWLPTMVPLTAGDTIERRLHTRAQDGVLAADHTSFRA